jgi:hypothetical protein
MLNVEQSEIPPSGKIEYLSNGEDSVDQPLQVEVETGDDDLLDAYSKAVVTAWK